MRDMRIAILTDKIESDYHIDLLSGVIRAAKGSRVRTLVVCGGWLGAEAPLTRNFAYDLLPQAGVDGVVVLAGSLSNFCGISAFEDWMRRFAHIPSVCLSLDVPPHAGVFTDNRGGVAALVGHLIDQHQARRIAFLRARNTSFEAEERYRGYEDALSRSGIPLDPTLVWQGRHFAREEGVRGIEVLLDERRIDLSELDAIACASDDIALGALEELTRRGIAVPDRVALVGFDDGPHAISSNPPLTTVNQRVELQGYEAGRCLIEALESGRPPTSRQLEAGLVLRASCGCRPPLSNDSAVVVRPASGLARTMALSLIERRSSIRAQMARAAAGRLGNQTGWEERLLNALAEDVGNRGSTFIQELELVGRRAVFLGGSSMPVHDVLTAIRLEALTSAAIEPELRPWLEDVFQEARLTLTKVALNAHRAREQAAAQRLRQLHKACMEVLETKELKGLSQALREHLPALGIEGYSITRLRQTEQHIEALELLAQRASDVTGRGQDVLPATSLGIDAGLEHQAVVVVQPLEFASRRVGLAAFAWGAHDPIVYEHLRDLLGVSVYAAQGGGPEAFPFGR